MCKNELEMRLYGTRFEDFSELYYFFSSIRSLLEYAAPAIFACHVILADFFFHGITLMDAERNRLYTDVNKIVMEEIWHILLFYYLLEIFAEALCWTINKLSSYKRLSAIKNLSWSTLLLMTLYVGVAFDTPAYIIGFLKAI